MNCEQIREQLVETARGRELSSDLRAIVFGHAADCDACGRRLEMERQLTMALSDLSLQEASVPARVEQMIRRQLPVPIRKPIPAVWKWAGLAAAASVALCALLIHPHRTPQPTPNVAVAGSAAEVFDADDFVPLPYAEDLQPGEQADVVRVQMTRESLLAMGVPVSADEFGDQVQADILLGMDGTARAIRLAD